MPLPSFAIPDAAIGRRPGHATTGREQNGSCIAEKTSMPGRNGIWNTSAPTATYRRESAERTDKSQGSRSRMEPREHNAVESAHSDLRSSKTI